MPHLDEGLISALLDGEIRSADLPPIQEHLRGCAECRARLEEERAFQGEADRLIGGLELPPAPLPAPRPAARPRVRVWPRNLAWAASVIAAAGLGYSVRSSNAPAAARADSARPTSQPALASAEAPQAAPGEDRPLSPKATTPPPVGSGDSPLPRERRKEAVNPGRRDESARAEPVGKVTDAVAAATPPAATARSAPALGGMLRSARELTAQPMRQEAEALVTPVGIGFPEAVARLGGALRLIEGLVPARLESLGPVIRVIYVLESGELVLSQERFEGKIRFSLTGPPGLPADSLARLRARIPE